jgi:tetratricopeptide (TPR) repeat protein
VSNVLAGLLGALLSTNQPAALSNLVSETTGFSIPISIPDGPAEEELRKIEEDDDAVLADIDKWIKEHRALVAVGAAGSNAALNDRIRSRIAPVKKAYADFIEHHPNHARAHLAFGAFLNDVGDEDGAGVEFEKATKLDPNMSAAWNNMGNHYGEYGPVTNAFQCYEKAISISPLEPLYYRNLATTVALFRKDAREFYNIDEQQVFTKALDLYAKAMKLDPANFELATDLAQTYYGIKPPRVADALIAWTNALKIAPTEFQREGVYVHLARFKFFDNRFADARQDLSVVTNADLQELKRRLLKNIDAREKGVTNSVPEIEPPAIAPAAAKKN